ncbi:MAG: hypothetical protein DYG89_14020 [Caldilinea sp. CFX5]|nr:hypothetical protein [Caldilinea sp. CFX5]
MAETTAHPEKPRRQRDLSWFLFIGFIISAVLLIGLIWQENLAGEEPGAPGYYRDTFVVDERVYATVTAEAATAAATVTPTGQ